MNINTNTLRQFRGDFKQAIKALEAQYGVEIDLGSISYSDTKFTSKITVFNNEAGNSGKQAEWNIYATRFGLNKDWFGKTVKLNSGTSATIVGIAPRSRKYPVLVETKDGGQYKMQVPAIAKQLNRVAPKASTPKPTVAPKGGSKLEVATELYSTNNAIKPSELAKQMGISNAYASKLLKKIKG